MARYSIGGCSLLLRCPVDYGDGDEEIFQRTAVGGCKRMARMAVRSGISAK